MNLDTFTKIIFMKRRIKSVFVVLFFISFLSFGQTKNDSISKRMKLVQPKYLVAGDSIAIIAPAGILIKRENIINEAKELAESWGLKVIIGDHVFNQNNHFQAQMKNVLVIFKMRWTTPVLRQFGAQEGAMVVGVF